MNCKIILLLPFQLTFLASLVSLHVAEAQSSRCQPCNLHADAIRQILSSYVDTGRYRKAVRELANLEAQAAKQGHLFCQLVILMKKTDVDPLAEHFEQTVVDADKGLQIAAAIEQRQRCSTDVVRVVLYKNRAEALRNLWQLDKAFESLKEAEKVIAEGKIPYPLSQLAQAEIVMQMGTVYFDMMNSWYLEGEVLGELARAGPQGPGESSNSSTQPTGELIPVDYYYEQARKRYIRAIDLFTALPENIAFRQRLIQSLGSCYYNLARLSHRYWVLKCKPRDKESWRWYEQAFANYHLAKDKFNELYNLAEPAAKLFAGRGLADVYVTLGLLWFEAGYPDEAAKVLNKAKGYIQQTHADTKVKLKLLRTEAEIAKAKNGFGKAEQLLQQAADALDATGAARSPLQSALFFSYWDVYDRLLDVQFSQDDVAGVFDTIERYRTKSLKQQLSLPQMSRPSLAQIQDWAKRNQAVILLYMLGQPYCYVCVVGVSGEPWVERLRMPEGAAKWLSDGGTIGLPDQGPLMARHLRLMIARELSAVGVPRKGLLAKLASQQMFTEWESLHALYRLLIPEKVRRELERGRVCTLLVAADGPLAWVPFDVLTLDPDGFRFVIDVTSVVQIPSCSVLWHMLSSTGRHAAGQEELLSVYVSSPPELNMSVWGQRYQILFSTLDGAKEESDAVTAMFGTAAEQIAEATEPEVRASMPGKRWIHLACHGFGSARRGVGFGVLAFMPDNSGELSPERDGWLFTSEVEQLDLEGCELVYLSACKTNFGLAIRGEAAWALARAFMAANARRVVAACWDCDDRTAAEVAIAFFKSIKDAVRRQDLHVGAYAQALRDAKLTARDSTGKGDVWKWGPFLLVGVP